MVRWSRRELIFAGFVAATVLLGLFVNFFRLEQVSALSDEPGYASAAWRYVHGDAAPPPAGTESGPDNAEHPPLAKLLFGLAQLVVGRPSIAVDRAVAAACVVLAALVLGLWLARVVNRWTGLLAGAFMVLLPQSVTPQLTRFSRTGMLDPVAELFMVGSIVAAWYWFVHMGRRSWLWAAGTGVAVGLAAASKENGFLGVLGPVVLGFALTRGWAGLRTRVLQTVLAVGVAILTFLATYLPLGQPLARIAYLWRFQLAHANEGHLIGFAGRVSADPPWWANFWFAGQGIGVVTAIALLVLAGLALVMVRSRPTWTLAAALVAPVLFHTVVARVTLPFYWTLWVPAFLGLAAIGLTALIREGATATGAGTSTIPGRRLVAGGLAAVLAVPVLWAVGTQLQGTATIRPVGPIAIPGVLEAQHIDGPIAIAGLYQSELNPYILGSRLRPALPAAATTDAVIVGQPRCRTPIDPGIRALVAANLATGALVPVYSDRLLVIYRSTRPLATPSAAEIAAQPPSRLEDAC